MDTFWTPELRSVDYAGVDFRLTTMILGQGGIGF